MSEEQVYTVKVNRYGTIYWHNSDGQLHRLDGPAIEWADGTKHWLQNGQYHRLGGPAYEGASGTKSWYQNGKLHRLDGPAIELESGTKIWYQNGKLHRLDGPAIEWVDGSKRWWIDDKELTESEFNERTKPDPCDGQYITLENGRKYLLTAVKGE